MTKTIAAWNDARTKGLAAALMRFGKIGFWIQLVLLIAIALLGGYVLKVAGGRAALGNILSFLGLVLPLFTTLWCRRYAALGKALSGGADTPSPAMVGRSLWVGVWAGAAGVVVTLISLLGAASGLMVTLLANPQVGVAVATISPGGADYQISAVDALSLMSLLLTQTAELMVVAMSLRLVFLFARSIRTGG
ncbi:DUF3611 family protein [Mangrovicoccus sp. HB161399]|uniref:DUF3611 family protein n=1 Tax=Mangrovicoccus sp. HB161399 TaxID=2720392 RepID=UPI001557D6E5|nr:DUF3611 family protein [Mangrovicoccus sp. HB161399]